jgi:elongation factor P--(R)-beta-lysine ligase
MSSDWKPAATASALQLRARLLAAVREYFAQQDVLEVETPVLAAAPATDVHLASLQTDVAGHGRFYLQTSPEYAMKRLLAAGLGDIYQVSRVFRDGERGPLHNPEFTLIEWYRLGYDADALMQDCERLLTGLLAPHLELGAAQRLTYAQAMKIHARVNALEASLDELRTCVRAHSPADAAQLDRDGCLDLLMSSVVGPKLGRGHLLFVRHYPASQAALARLNAQDPSVAERFEIYLEGIELANGFHELADASEQHVRFERDIAARGRKGLAMVPGDERLLAALERGLPECSGVALGFDRVVMLAAGARTLDEVIAFPIERA